MNSVRYFRKKLYGQRKQMRSGHQNNGNLWSSSSYLIENDRAEVMPNATHSKPVDIQAFVSLSREWEKR